MITWLFILSLLFQLPMSPGISRFGRQPGETSVNVPYLDAIVYLLDYAECPYRLTGKDAQYCNGTRPVRTALHGPAANGALRRSAGDNNGYATSPSSAYANDGLFAVDTNSGTSTSTSCTSTRKDKHD